MNLIIGYPLDHSLSPVLHNFVYGLENIPAKMEKYAEPAVGRAIRKIREENIRLTAVTMPHKESIIEYLDEADGVALAIGSVNTVINRDGKLYGYNTDVIGIEQALAGVEIANKNVLLLGAGGVARAVAYFLRENNCQTLIYNRTMEKAEEIADKFGGQVVTDLACIDGKEISLIINCTPVGMGDLKDELPLPANILKQNQVVFDIIYNPRKTTLLTRAEEAGARIISGLDMLIEQGLEQIKITYGLKNSRAELRQGAKTELLKYLL